MILWLSSFLVSGVYISNLADVLNISYFEHRNTNLLSCYQIVFASWNPNRKSKNKRSQEHLVVIVLLLSFLQLNSSSAEGVMQLFSSYFPAQGSSTSKRLRNNLSPPSLASYRCDLQGKIKDIHILELGVFHLGSLIYKSCQWILNASFWFRNCCFQVAFISNIQLYCAPLNIWFMDCKMYADRLQNAFIDHSPNNNTCSSPP